MPGPFAKLSTRKLRAVSMQLASIRTDRGFHVGDTVKFLTHTSTFLDNVKEWSGPFLDTHQLGIRLNFDVDVKILLSTSKL